MANIYGRQTVLPLANKSGGSVVAGDVVIVDTSNNEAFTTTTSSASTNAIGVAAETIANNATGRVVIGGYVPLVNVSASVTRGNYAITHTVAKQATESASRVAGTFGRYLKTSATPSAFIYPVDLGGAALTNPMTTAGDIIVGGASGAPARLAIGADKTYLRSNGTTPSWVQPVKHGTPILRTGGSHTCNSTTWVELAAATGGPGTGTYDFDFTGVAAGDILEVSISGGWGSEATNGCLTWVTIVSASPVTYIMGAPTTSTGDGVVGLYGFSGTFQGVAATAYYVIQSGDLSAGALKVRPYYRTTSATNKTFYGTTGDPSMFMARVWRP